MPKEDPTVRRVKVARVAIARAAKSDDPAVIAAAYTDYNEAYVARFAKQMLHKAGDNLSTKTTARLAVLAGDEG